MDTSTGVFVAPFIAPPGPSSFTARLAAARAATETGKPFHFLVPTRPNRPALPLVAVWVWPDCEMPNGGTLWSGPVGPHVLRFEVVGRPVEQRPLAFVVRLGHEEADYTALLRQIERDGVKLDALVHNVFDWMPHGLGRGQFVAMLPVPTLSNE